MKAGAILVVLATLSSGCLVLSVHPAYDRDSLAWEPALVGQWQAADDRSSMQVEVGEWKSYKIHYVHPTETGDVTGYLTTLGADRILDVMPARGEDRGAFLLPVHAVFRIRLDGDRLELTPLAYDWFVDRLRAGGRVPGLTVALDQKENALIGSPTEKLRAWMGRQPSDGRMFGAPAVFARSRGQPPFDLD